ncbi:MAG: HEAT repeat domain-containing protein [Syntrophomonadaceae bacterium]
MRLFRPNVQKMFEKSDVKGLIKALNDSEPSIGIAAAEALGNIGDPRAVAPLITSLQNKGYLMRHAAEALGKIGDPQAIEPLIAVLDVDRPKVFADALENIAVPTDPAVQARYFIAISKWEKVASLGEVAIEPLVASIKRHPGPATKALAKIGTSRAIDVLIAALKAKDSKVYIAAAAALAEIGEEILEPLITALRDNNDNNMAHNAAVDTFVKIGEPAIEPLINALNYGNWGLSRCASEALGKIGDARAVEPLISTLKRDPDNIKAVIALQEIGDRRAVDTLIQIFNNKAIYDTAYSVESWLDIAYSLGKLGGDSATDALINWKCNKDAKSSYYHGASPLPYKIITGVKKAMVACGEESIPQFVASLDKSRPEIADVLQQLGWTPGSDQELIAHAYASGNYIVAAKIGFHTLEPLLIKLGFENIDGQWVSKTGDISGNGDIDYKDTYEIAAIATALGETGDSRAVGPLTLIKSARLSKGLWPSGNHIIRKAATDALAKLLS